MPKPSRNVSPSKTVADSELHGLLRKRSVIKCRLIQFAEYVDSLGESLSNQSVGVLQKQLNQAADLYCQYKNVQDAIEEIVNESELETQIQESIDVQNMYFDSAAKAECILDSKPSCENHNIRANPSTTSVKLPTINLPSFDGKCEQWLEFRDTFMSLIHQSHELSEVQKFHYLKSALHGSARLIIDSLEFSSSNYQIAWELLVNRFDNNRLLIQNHVKSLFSIDPIEKESSFLLRKLTDSVLKNLRALKNLGEPTESWDTLIVYLIVSKLDKISEREWEQFKGTLLTQDDSPNFKFTLNHLLNFLNRRADMLDTLQATRSKSSSHPHSATHAKPNTFNHSKNIQCYLSNNKPSITSCPMCNGEHKLFFCRKFIGLDISQRRKFVTENNICKNCLRSGHPVNNCSFGNCKRCNKKHNSLLHEDTSHTPPAPDPKSTSHDNKPISSLTITTSQSHRLCLLSTAVVNVRLQNSQYQQARVLLDNGSEECFVSRAFCEAFKLPMRKCIKEIRGVGGIITKTISTCDLTIKSRVTSYTRTIKCYVLDEITAVTPSTPIDTSLFTIPTHIQLGDSEFYNPRGIDILIGANVFWELLGNHRHKLKNGPYLQQTVLGWVVSGPIFCSTPNDKRAIRCNVSQVLDEQLTKFWEIEEIGQPSQILSEEERACEESFVKTTTRNHEGRFCVRIPFKESTDMLGESYDLAKRRFFALEKKLNRSPSMKRLYSDFMNEYIQLGHMTKIDILPQKHYFLPHHGVLRQNSVTTKLRVVFDASAATSTGKSLNDIQRVGPPIQGDLFAILLRFRQFKFTACADIEKMYRQCLVHNDDRKFQLIVWRENLSDELHIYQLNTVTYGTASAPFLSIRCLKQCAIESSNDKVKDVIDNHFYVDDMLLSHDDKHELLHLCEQVATTLKQGCFPLHKWRFNFECDTNLPKTIDSKPINSAEPVQSKTLGLGWDTVSDTFNFNTEIINNDSPVTKRKVLSYISQIFDPLGLLGPVTIQAKVLMQQLWLVKIGWDEDIPADLVTSWGNFVDSLKNLNAIHIPRHVAIHKPTHLSLHIFTDASQTAYGACAYIRSVNQEGKIVTRLLCAKSKVAPIKPVTIPRLELCGAHLGAKLYDKIKNSLQVKFDEVTFWTDSTIVIGWLRMAPGLLKPFVQNRVGEIHELTKNHSWRHVSGKDNPADIISRGEHVANLLESKLWWDGPQFLSQSTFDISNFPIGENLEELPEIKTNPIYSFQVVVDTRKLVEFEKFSKLNRLKRAFAYALRFITNARSPRHERQSGDLSIEELNNSEIQLAILAQRESFPTEYKALQKGEPLLANSKLISFNPFYDNQGIIRVGGRIQYSTLFEYNKKHPIVLDGKHHFSLLLIRDAHKMLFHAPSQTVLYHLRETWWPIGGQRIVKKVIHECITCKRFKAKPAAPIMGNLPKTRITPSFPFDRCGVDYAGPIFTLNRRGRGAKLQKSYICLFICFITRAVHLELVSDLSANSYLLALKRFISRKGKPTEIISDNGKNFVGAMSEFKRLINDKSIQNEINTLSIQNNIKFSFIPPYSPHFGGLWEAGVKSCKHHLVRIMKNAHLTFEELYTVLSQIEAILNSRPLSPLSSDANDLQPLTPGHFLIGRAFTSPVVSSLKEIQENRLSRFQHIEKIRQNFWERWSKEYISQMQTRVKWKTSKSAVLPKMLVLVKDDNLPPLRWRLGRIVNTVTGKDGISRVATIKTATGIITRSFSKICPLLDENQNLQ